MVIVAAWLYLPDRHDTVARAGASPEERRELLVEKEARDRTELAEYGWIDESEGRVRLPIERAMELAVEEIGREETIVFGDFEDLEEEAEEPAEPEGEAEAEDPEANDSDEDPEEHDDREKAENDELQG